MSRQMYGLLKTDKEDWDRSTPKSGLSPPLMKAYVTKITIQTICVKQTIEMSLSLYDRKPYIYWCRHFLSEIQQKKSSGSLALNSGARGNNKFFSLFLQPTYIRKFGNYEWNVLYKLKLFHFGTNFSRKFRFLFLNKSNFLGACSLID